MPFILARILRNRVHISALGPVQLGSRCQVRDQDLTSLLAALHRLVIACLTLRLNKEGLAQALTQHMDSRGATLKDTRLVHQSKSEKRANAKSGGVRVVFRPARWVLDC